jgi:DNA polymerase III subunit beta
MEEAAMRFSIPQKEFQSQLQKLIAVVPSKTTHPILNSILFRLEGNRLELTATDLEVSLVSTLRVEGDENGELAITAKRLLEIVRELDDLPLVLQSDRNHSVELRCGSGSFQLPGESAEAFPVLPQVDVQSELSMPPARLRRHIERLGFAASADELRPVLTGVLFEFREEGLNLVATDGHRLVRLRDELFAGQQELGSVVVPVKALNLVARSLEHDDEPIQIGLAQSHLLFRLGELRLYTRLIEGRYPAYEGVIPQQNENLLQAPRQTIYRAVKQVSHCANSITRQVNFSLSEDRLVISAEDNEYGSRGRSELDVDYSGEPIEIAFNSSYVDQMLRQVETDSVVFKFGTPERAALILPEVNEEKEDFLMLLMPVRLMRS